ncbi:hypothetical protein B9G69_010785 [Bdellovibrio sp. SKB1291214]|uniref:hypothetical protein n=1 Tax=Bdellovibrio sp. SKB1291214 TaxID=1732569 RepID=UPI000B51CE12|nr:hypothetical protein [Bdellovibrio sp. SKB1291214]UYL07530.1 hypothetical protein B9G69_010785 [Bdellovibrio sp. SKB1291214]
MNKRGQIVVEYVLLLVIATGVAALLVSQLVSRNSDNPGVLTSKWHSILVTIGADVPDSNKK